jgi:hypothetical protein
MEEEEMEQLQERIEEDYEMGDTIRGRLIPHAVSWWVGEGRRAGRQAGWQERREKPSKRTTLR